VISKLTNFEGAANYMASKGLSLVSLLLVGAIAVELLGGLSLMLGFKTRYGAALLFLFMIPTTFIFHDFWSVSEAEYQMQFLMFFKNLAIMGGLLYVISSGPGCFSLDAFCCYNKDDEACRMRD
jgi:putative oxidoreductase